MKSVNNSSNISLEDWSMSVSNFSYVSYAKENCIIMTKPAVQQSYASHGFYKMLDVLIYVDGELKCETNDLAKAFNLCENYMQLKAVL